MRRSGTKVIQANKYVRIDPTILLQQRTKYITNGKDNDFFYYTEQQYVNSPTNAAIIDSVVRWTIGDGLVELGGKDWTKILSEEDLEGIVFDYKMHGSACIQVVYNLEGGVAKLHHIPTRSIAIVRTQKDLNEEPDAYWYSFDWRYKTQFKPYMIKAYRTGDGIETELYRILSKSVQPLFPLPDYVNCLQWCEVEAEMSNFSVKHLKNNFTAGRVVNIFSGNLQATNEEDLEVEKAIIEQQFVGTDNAGKVIVSYYDNPDEKTTIDDIPIVDAHTQFRSLSKEAEDMIMRAHKIPSGSLFNLPNPSGFGNAGDEMKMALKMMYKQNINPLRNKIIGALNELFGEEWNFEFRDFDLSDGVTDSTEDENEATIEMKNWRVSNINSSNVRRMLYNDETFELVVEFNDGDVYTYFDIDFDLFQDVYNGRAVCTTSGENKWGNWWIGKTPSVGAAVDQLLEGKSYEKGGTLK